MGLTCTSNKDVYMVGIVSLQPCTVPADIVSLLQRRVCSYQFANLFCTVCLHMLHLPVEKYVLLFTVLHLQCIGTAVNVACRFSGPCAIASSVIWKWLNCMPLYSNTSLFSQHLSHASDYAGHLRQHEHVCIWPHCVADSPCPTPTRAAVLGEFGGVSRNTPGHEWDPAHSFTYKTIVSLVCTICAAAACTAACTAACSMHKCKPVVHFFGFQAHVYMHTQPLLVPCPPSPSTLLCLELGMWYVLGAWYVAYTTCMVCCA